ncbi:MAG TPA: hypothetical protein VJ921_09685 [Vicinamibacteria bacterium]|nr:hypothetical protein [Vicinamibacteria bacterium]
MSALLLAAALGLLTLVQEMERAHLRGDGALLENARDELRVES